ncbi:hypothetical protein A8L45_17105 [Veronia pacifica]|uniref:Haem-binding uptake Tiki superfamily ChaN domain-containing protein n=1 Tax=Veronia pacifica TaxID=1080227 RepID=A0A1C3EDY8_9GAMM|nr:hypothetical protein A8L45_17105 [Veronia pacifica]
MIIICFSAFIFSGCQSTFLSQKDASNEKHQISSSIPVRADTLYHYQIISPDGLPISLIDMADGVKDKDVVLVGEWHTHPAVHLFQAQLMAALADRNPKLVLSMEQFSRPDQTVIDRYLEGEIGEQALLSQTAAWPNYRSDYRPLVDIARQRGLTVLAANTTKTIVRCLAEHGPDIIKKMPAEQQKYVARELDTTDGPYKAKFLARMGGDQSDALEGLYAAQVAWDETMAETITEHLTFHPGSQIMHVAGSFHVEGGLGIASRILRRDATLTTALIVPSSVLNPVSGDAKSYRLLISPLPERVVSGEENLSSGASSHTRLPERCPY